MATDKLILRQESSSWRWETDSSWAALKKSSSTWSQQFSILTAWWVTLAKLVILPTLPFKKGNNGISFARKEQSPFTIRRKKDGSFPDSRSNGISEKRLPAADFETPSLLPRTLLSNAKISDEPHISHSAAMMISLALTASIPVSSLRRDFFLRAILSLLSNKYVHFRLPSVRRFFR